MSCGKCGTKFCICHLCGRCNHKPCTCVSNPYYLQVPVCQEDHTQKIYQSQFYFSICPVVVWNVPGCNGVAVLRVPGVAGITIGSFIWHPLFGYYEITAVNVQAGTISVRNPCIEGNVAIGTQVPACTCFIFTDPPAGIDQAGLACLALDFVAPAVGDCVLITVTSLGVIQVGDLIQLGTARYRVDSIDGSDTITICNDGLGFLEGTVVIAVVNGIFQYCFQVVSNCCNIIQDSLLNAGGTNQGGVGSGDLAMGDVISGVASLTINNTSDSSMLVHIDYELYSSVTPDDTVAALVNFVPQESINGAPYANLVVLSSSFLGMIAGVTLAPYSFSYSVSKLELIAAGGSLQVDFRTTLALIDSNPGAVEAAVFSRLTMFGVAI